MHQSERVGLYIDQANLNASGGFEMDYAVLREFALRGGARGVHLNVYSSVNPAKAERDPAWNSRLRAYQAQIRSLGYHINLKEAKEYGEGDRLVIKANADVDIAVDVLENASKLDRILLVSGDGDFSSLISAARRQGARVECLAFDNCSELLRGAADAVYPGWIIPELLPATQTEGDSKNFRWGEPGSRLRGIVQKVDPENRIGFVRYVPCFQDADPAFKFSPLSPDTHLVCPFSLDDLPAHHIALLRGAILEFSLTESATMGRDSKIVRIASRSGWYKPLVDN